MRNEKYYEYFEVGKNKDLIEKHALTENDLLIFKKLRNYEIKESKKGCIIITIFFAIIILLAFTGDIFSGMIFLVVFSTIDFFAIKHHFNLKNFEPEYCDYGIVTDKFIKKEKGDDDRYIIISVNNNLVKFKVSFSEYESLNLDDEVILFACKDTNDLFYHSK